MIIGIPDDYVNLVRNLDCIRMLDGHEVHVWTDAVRDVDVLESRFRDLDALVLLRERTVLSGELIGRLPKLRIIAMSGPHPNVDARACTRNGTALSVGHGRVSYATAELTWGLVISAMRKIPQQMARLRDGGWQTEMGLGLRARTLGVVGYGKIGKVVAGYGAAFGMRVLVWSRARGLAEARSDGFETCSDKGDLLERSDVVSLHVRYTEETRGLITSADLARMKTTAVLVNTSRSGLIERGALAAALAQGRPGGAAVDVYDLEPPGQEPDPLTLMANVVCTPHLGYVERDQMEAYFRDQFQRLLSFDAGKPLDIENPAALAMRKVDR